jgi:hypothetical protein
MGEWAPASRAGTGAGLDQAFVFAPSLLALFAMTGLIRGFADAFDVKRFPFPAAGIEGAETKARPRHGNRQQCKSALPSCVRNKDR